MIQGRSAPILEKLNLQEQIILLDRKVSLCHGVDPKSIPSTALRRDACDPLAQFTGRRLILIKLTATQTAHLKEGRYVYDVILINNTDGKIYRAVEGMALVNPGVTDVQSGIIPPSTPPVAVGPTPPENPIQGNLWWNTHEGRMYIFYTDQDSSQWVQTNPSSKDNERSF